MQIIFRKKINLKNLDSGFYQLLKYFLLLIQRCSGKVVEKRANAKCFAFQVNAINEHVMRGGHIDNQTCPDADAVRDILGKLKNVITSNN